ncbi:chloride channel protein [Olsenella sp. YH-ols2217]|uniref:Chloride channel protein n=1 Tax=Kribbibacterium absianum TaxID=3044210 RepID=A0ABT6ZIT0_9ACTN|nr:MULTISPECIES: chloride channel protein [unclassified Olsenella]MDJ1121468.1 chloride channel protein [Olsenella sp. YH-ols2216]MDJ1128958.1 chloride channel protein [Olsenella sp. YH-ols2217]
MDQVSKRLSRRFQAGLVWKGFLTGLGAGVVVAAYRVALGACDRTVRAVTPLLYQSPGGVALWVAVLALLVMAVGSLMRWAPDTSGSGIPQVEAEIMGRLRIPWLKAACVKFAEGVLCAFGGLSLGREGPSVMMGGLLGKGVSRATKSAEGEERLLMTCGAGAGMAAAFQAPLTGVMFAIEEVQKTVSAPLVIATLSSTVTSVFVVNQVFDVQPVLGLSFAQELPHITYGVVALMGVAMGLLGALGNLGMFLGQRLYARVNRAAPYSRLAVPFAAAGLAAAFAPALMGGGDAVLELLARPEGLTVGLLLGLLVGKYLFTNLCAGSRAPGGTLYPLVVMGALAGALFGKAAVALLGLPSSYLVNFMLLGIAGVFASVVQAPVTGCVLVFELTGSFTALLSLGLVSLVSYVVAKLVAVDGYYEHLLANLLKVSEPPHAWAPHRHVLIRTLVVGCGSEADGALLEELTLPEGVAVALVERSGASLVPEPGLQLACADHVVVVIDSRLEAGVEPVLEEMVAPAFEEPA